jgi:small subunit ribosomal protein S18
MNTKEQKVRTCRFCVDKKLVVDYKDIGMLARFVSSYKKIAPRRRSGLCAKHQRQVSTAIKRARQNALMPYMAR